VKKLFIVLLLSAITLTGCRSDSDVASHNLSKDAEMFRIQRRVVFYNSIQDVYMLSIEGKCSVEKWNGQLAVTCKTGDTAYKKHYLGLSDNVTYFAEQLESANVSTYHYKVIFKPSVILPDVELSK
jgi:hypothetical protein